MLPLKMMAVKQKAHIKNYWMKLLKKYGMRFRGHPSLINAHPRL